MRFEIKGLDALQSRLKEAQRAFDALDGELGTVTVTSDPASIETAIAQMEQVVDERIEVYRSNPLVAKVGAELKERYAAAIRAKGEAFLADLDDLQATRFEASQITENMDPDSDTTPPTTKDAQRYLVLDYFYRFNEEHCADEQWSGYAATDLQGQGHQMTHGDVARAITYLSDKGLLRVTKRQGYISGEETVVRASITARGIDAIERPNEFKGVLSAQVINYINHGSMNVAQGDQQVVGRDNTGVLSQGKSRVEQRNDFPAFPAERLRVEFAGHEEAISAIDSLDAELKKEHPHTSSLFAAVESIKNVANVVDVGKIFWNWLADPAVQHHLLTITSRTLGI